MPTFASRSQIGTTTRLWEASGRQFTKQTADNTYVMPTVFCSRAHAKAWSSLCQLVIAQTRHEPPLTTIPHSNTLRVSASLSLKVNHGKPEQPGPRFLSGLLRKQSRFIVEYRLPT